MIASTSTASTETPLEGHIILPRVSLIRREPGIQKHNIQKEVTILKSLNKAKFPVYLAALKGDSKLYAMKVFPSEEARAQKYFQNERRFSALSHPHIIQTILVEQDKSLVYKGSKKLVSFILFEYAAFGDLLNFMAEYKKHFTEKLVRTYFHQLIQGLKYLHQNDVAHLDLKLDNLLIDENYQLKIADFDLACNTRDSVILSNGTQFYRAPELKESECMDYLAADIYSAGVILFILMSQGKLPHSESITCNGINLFDLLNSNNAEFWSMHCEIQGKRPSYYSSSFRNLFNGMTKVKVSERKTIEEIEKLEWFNGPIYTAQELKNYFNKITSKKSGTQIL